MEQTKHIDMQTPNGAELNLDALYKIAPSCFTEAKNDNGEVRHVVDFNKLRLLLGDNAVEDAPEVYDFTWVGKRAALQEAAAPINKTLRPCPEESVDWDKTQNLYIEGDNLEVLKLLQNSYMGKVKMIYIDPPYNTGNDFVYHDDFKQSVEEYDEHNSNEEGERFRKNTDSNGRFHSDWCSMMYARLMVARSLLTDNGAIFISIDDNEQRNLKNICDEIFGESNYIATFPRLTTKSGKTPLTYMISHDYILCYVKNAKDIFTGKVYEDDSYKYEDEYVEERGKYNLKQPLDCNSISYSKSLDYPIEYEGETYYPGGDYQKFLERKHGNYLKKDYAWRWSKELFEFGLENGWIVFQNARIYTKGYLNATIEKNSDGSYFISKRKKTRKLSTIDFIKNEYSNDIAKKQVASYKIDAKFDYPKPYNLIYDLIESYIDKNCIVLDFFSGSSSTADAVLRLNSEDKGNRKFIMVQLQEGIDSNDNYKTICDIGKERIRRAGKKIKEKNPLTTQDLDTGFRVFKCESSNYKDVAFAPKDYDQSQLEMFVDNIKDGRTDLDLLFDCMLRWGVELSLPLSTTKVDGCTIHNVNDGDLVACFDGNVTETVIDAIAALSPVRVVFRDSSFNEAAQKMNLFELFKQKCDWTDEEVKKNVRVI